MSEINNNYVYPGGSMSGPDFYQAELEVSEEMPVWIEPECEGIEATIAGEEIVLSRLNSKVYDFNDGTVEGLECDYEFMSHIYVYRGKGRPAFWYTIPEGEEEAERWRDLANRLISIDCDYICGLPKTIDFEQMHQFMRGDEEMDDILKRIVEEEYRG